ncbi:MAG: TetR family transcriptional regulator [Candidatus Nanopelagicales bacterium]
MHIAVDLDARQAGDLTARARIRDAAIECFAAEGFDSPFRRIASRATVSPGLITHHFGSKKALREECDAEVLRRYKAVKITGIGRPGPQLIESLTAPGASANLLVYILRAVAAGGPAAVAFLDHLIDDLRPVMAASVASGLVRPSRDEDARLRYLTYQSLGALLVQFLAAPGATPEAFVESLRAGQGASILPMLELLTEGLFRDSQLLEDYLQYLWEPPDARAGATRRAPTA